MVYLIGCAAGRRRIGAVCSGVPWSIGPGVHEVVLFDRAVRVAGKIAPPCGREAARCGLCGLRIGEDIAGHPLESLDPAIGVAIWS